MFHMYYMCCYPQSLHATGMYARGYYFFLAYPHLLVYVSGQSQNIIGTSRKGTTRCIPVMTQPFLRNLQMYTYTHKYQIRKYTNIAVSARKRYVFIALLSTTPYSAYLHVVPLPCTVYFPQQSKEKYPLRTPFARNKRIYAKSVPGQCILFILRSGERCSTQVHLG